MTVYKNFKNPSQMTEKEQQELGGKAVVSEAFPQITWGGRS